MAQQFSFPAPVNIPQIGNINPVGLLQNAAISQQKHLSTIVDLLTQIRDTLNGVAASVSSMSQASPQQSKNPNPSFRPSFSMRGRLGDLFAQGAGSSGGFLMGGAVNAARMALNLLPNPKDMLGGGQGISQAIKSAGQPLIRGATSVGGSTAGKLAGGALSVGAAGLGVAATAVTALAGAAALAAGTVAGLSYAAVSLSESFKEFSPQIAAIFARSDARDLFRSQRVGAGIADTTETMMESLGNLKDAFEPILVNVINILNQIATYVFDALSQILKFIQSNLEMLSTLVDWFTFGLGGDLMEGIFRNTKEDAKQRQEAAKKANDAYFEYLRRGANGNFGRFPERRLAPAGGA